MHCHFEEGVTVLVQASKVMLLSANLILASGSPRRSEIMKSAGFDFMTRVSEVDEDAIGDGLPAAELAVALAKAKALAVATDLSDATVIGADTVVSQDGALYAKPQNADDAHRMLRELAGRSHTVITGVAVVANGEMVSGHKSTIVNMRDYDAVEIAAYVESGSPLDKAGGYGIQDESFMPAASIEGCYLNVVGLPICLTGDLLSNAQVIRNADRPMCAGHDLLPGLAI
jgi:MAF protein